MGHILLRYILQLLFVLLLTGCVWAGYVPPQNGTPAVGMKPGPVIYQQNLTNSRYKKASLEAVEVARKVILHPEFKRRLKDQRLLRYCDDTKREAGDIVYKNLMENAESFSLVARRSYKSFTTKGIADIGNQRVAIRPSRFKGWSAEREKRALFLNTLVHETLHMVPGDLNGFQYTDKGQGGENCPKAEFASYFVGNLAEDIYIEYFDVFE